jgi:hypothetical protein
MTNEPPDHLEGVLNRPGGGAKRSGNAKKILNRGNEAKHLLKAQDLAFSGPQNKLFFECKKPRSKRKNRGCSAGPVPPDGRPRPLQKQKSEEQQSGVRIQEPGVRMKSICSPRLPSACCRPPAAFEGSSSWRDSWPVLQTTTTCHRRQGKKKLVTLKSEGT